MGTVQSLAQVQTRHQATSRFTLREIAMAREGDPDYMVHWKTWEGELHSRGSCRRGLCDADETHRGGREEEGVRI